MANGFGFECYCRHCGHTEIFTLYGPKCRVWVSVDEIICSSCGRDDTLELRNAVRSLEPQEFPDKFDWDELLNDS